MSDDEGSVLVKQYVYFALKSDITTPEAITAKLGFQPDRVGVRGSSQTTPPVPATHTWAVECRKPRMTVDEQVSEVLDRIRPLANGIRELVEPGEIEAVLQIVRYFEVDDGDPQAAEDGPPESLLGWHLTIADLAFLVSIDADVSVDEYSV
ncbi:hypothetical protein GCM10010435_36980 [Winogradskya consettensis]|uniref:DUF4279 domain-containing protein n=1 Tax=Winogradskya consettensis TaxID=113560 RepID=A0A919T1Z5_9ACTN|nr:DUF4279 domain-containing protein [Actinoplanes consettensis]GIM83961.1 hypothetical protein Aco04nite_89110 [Actinoplanes consettensis]